MWGQGSFPAWEGGSQEVSLPIFKDQPFCGPP